MTVFHSFIEVRSKVRFKSRIEFKSVCERVHQCTFNKEKPLAIPINDEDRRRNEIKLEFSGLVCIVTNRNQLGWVVRQVMIGCV